MYWERIIPVTWPLHKLLCITGTFAISGIFSSQSCCFYFLFEFKNNHVWIWFEKKPRLQRFHAAVNRRDYVAPALKTGTSVGKRRVPLARARPGNTATMRSSSAGGQNPHNPTQTAAWSWVAAAAAAAVPHAAAPPPPVTKHNPEDRTAATRRGSTCRFLYCCGRVSRWKLLVSHWATILSPIVTPHSQCCWNCAIKMTQLPITHLKRGPITSTTLFHE